MVKNYEKNKVYKIYSHLGDKIYVGSTTKDLLSQRMATHRSCYKCWKSGKKGFNFVRAYILFDEYGIDNCIIELIEAKPCINIHDAGKLEGTYIRDMICTNKNIAGRTNKEYREENKVRLSDLNKEYYIKNKEYIINKVRQYSIDNKDLISERGKVYRTKHEVKIKEFKGEPKICDCGLFYTHAHKARHLKTLKHKQSLENQNKL